MSESNMKAVMRQTGLTPDRLRVWEKRYGAVRPSRAENGRRVYREAEIRRLKLLATLVERGHSIGSIARLSDEELLVRVGNSADVRDRSGTDLSELLEALARFDLERIRIKLGLLRYSRSPREFAFEIVPQVMMLVGKKIEAGTLTIAQEHALSELFQGHLKSIYEDLASLDGIRASEGAFLFCTREGDAHDFGLLMAAIAARAAGLRTHYVGRNLPAEALAEAARKLKPRAVVIGMAAIPATEQKISPADYLAAIHAKLDASTEFWIGGPGSRALKRPKSDRAVFIFESIEDLEEKLKAMAPVKGLLA